MDVDVPSPRRRMRSAAMSKVALAAANTRQHSHVTQKTAHGSEGHKRPTRNYRWSDGRVGRRAAAHAAGRDDRVVEAVDGGLHVAGPAPLDVVDHGACVAAPAAQVVPCKQADR